MYSSPYEEYIRNILGYNPMNPNSYQEMEQPMIPYYRETNTVFPIQELSSELDQCYPEIYKVVYPMVQKRCENMDGPITRETVENMTDEIYMAIESSTEINIAINLKNDVKTTTQQTMNRKADVKTNSSEMVENRELRGRNQGLRDIIKILLLRELLGGGRPPVRPPRPPRPPFPGPGGRPPFPPGGPGGRPPIMPRDFDIYEM